MVTHPETRPLVVRAREDQSKDQSLANDALKAADLGSLHAMVSRLIDDRTKLAEAFDAIIQGVNMLRDVPVSAGSGGSNTDAIERVATQAIEFAREVVQALTKDK